MVRVSIVRVVIEVRFRKVTGFYYCDDNEFDTREIAENVKDVISEKTTQV